MPPKKIKNKLDMSPFKTDQMLNKPIEKSVYRKTSSTITYILIGLLALSFVLNIYLAVRDCDSDTMELLDQCSESVASGQEQLNTCTTDLAASQASYVQCLQNAATGMTAGSQDPID